jgi:hypothetical protein
MMISIRSKLPGLLFMALTPAAFGQSVTVTDDTDEGMDCFKIVTPSATYFYQKEAAGFSSLLDAEGNDWIGYRPGDGPDGEYRGIPNLGGCCHPGYSGHTSTIKEQTDDKVVIESSKGDWLVQWEFFATHATLTVVQNGGDYYMLYEGTPGGRWESDDYYYLSDGTKTDCEQSRTGQDLPGDEWIAFGDASLERVLFLHHHENDDKSDDYWGMYDAMTVFGFGRGHGVMQSAKLLDTAPRHFTLGLIESTDFATIKETIESIHSGQTEADPAVSPHARPHRGGVHLSESLHGGIVVTVPAARIERIEVVDAGGRMLYRYAGIGATRHVIGRDRLSAGVVSVRCRAAGETWTGLWIVK